MSVPDGNEIFLFEVDSKVDNSLLVKIGDGIPK